MKPEKITLMASEPQYEEVRAYRGGDSTQTLLKLEQRSKVKNAE